MRREPTVFEKHLWRRLSGSQLGFKFRRQHVIGPYICDFFCPQKGLIVEVDGDTHDAEADARRDARLAKDGFLTLRFTNRDVKENMEGVLETILQRLRTRAERWAGDVPHSPTPFPEGEGKV